MSEGFKEKLSYAIYKSAYLIYSFVHEKTAEQPVPVSEISELSMPLCPFPPHLNELLNTRRAENYQTL